MVLGRHYAYIDDCFAVSRTPAGAISILEDLENELRDKWELTMKPTLRSFVEAKGGKRGALDEQKWPKQETFNVLGHCAFSKKSSVRTG